MTAPLEDPLPDVGTVDDTEPVVLEDVGEPDQDHLRAAVAHLKGHDAHGAEYADDEVL